MEIIVIFASPWPPFFPGYDGVADYSKCNTTCTMPYRTRMRRGADINTYLPQLIKGLQCLGNEDNVLDCVIQAAISILSNMKFKALPPGSPVPVADVAWVSCKGKLDTAAVAIKPFSPFGLQVYCE